ARRVAAQRADLRERAAELAARAARGHEIGMAVGVIAEGVAVAQLAQQQVFEAGAQLPPDHEERRRRALALEHRDERRRRGRGAVVEAERHLAARRAAAVRAAAAAT